MAWYWGGWGAVADVGEGGLHLVEKLEARVSKRRCVARVLEMGLERTMSSSSWIWVSISPIVKVVGVAGCGSVNGDRGGSWLLFEVFAVSLKIECERFQERVMAVVRLRQEQGS